MCVCVCEFYFGTHNYGGCQVHLKSLEVKNNMRFEKGVKELSTELKNKTVSITYDAEKTDVKKLQAGFKKFNYEAEFVKETKQDGKKDSKQESKKEDKKADKK